MKRYLPLLACLLVSCVDPISLTLPGTVDVIVVDGTITNRAEPQQIRLNRSKADPFTGRFGTLPLTKIKVEVIVDSARTITCRETDPGTYQLPDGFRGEIGHAYQLRFSLGDGTRYVSTQQVMLAVPPIDRLRVEFNPKSLPGDQYGGVKSVLGNFKLLIISLLIENY